MRRGVRATFLGQTVTQVVRRRPDLRWPIPDEIVERLPGRCLEVVERRSKYLLLGFGDATALVHLGMSGTLVARATGDPLRPHDHVDFVFGPRLLRLNDPRRFGAVLWSDADVPGTLATMPLLQGLGVEPFDAAFDAAHLHARCAGRSVAIKPFLLAGSAVVGVGNIYACESLFQAGIRPTLAAGAVSRPRIERLVQAIRTVLGASIAAGGSTLRDFVASEGTRGHFQVQCAVYGRAGLPCRVCATPIRQIRQAQRSTFFCPHCQRR